VAGVKLVSRLPISANPGSVPPPDPQPEPNRPDGVWDNRRAWTLTTSIDGLYLSRANVLHGACT
jgi:hypothetical protein